MTFRMMTLYTTALSITKLRIMTLSITIKNVTLSINGTTPFSMHAEFFMLCVIMLSVFMLSVFMLSVFMLGVVMPIFEAPFFSMMIAHFY